MNPIEEAKAKKKLATTLVKVCSVCWKEDDHETEDEVSSGFSVTLVRCGFTFHVQLHHQRI